jgi:hypothetical protein
MYCVQYLDYGTTYDRQKPNSLDSAADRQTTAIRPAETP